MILTTLLSLALIGCDEDESDDAPPLDVRGVYEVSWNGSLRDPETSVYESDPSAVNGGGSGFVTVLSTDENILHGTFTILDGASPPFASVELPFTARMKRVYFAIEDPVDYGWDLTVTSPVDDLVGCTYVGPVEVNSPGIIGVGRIDPELVINLAFGGIYDCGPTRRHVIVGALGHRLGRAASRARTKVAG
ncbi:MAG TPA: hypothetical protein VF720_13535 [Candidatus Eisenbacteria bacterium]